MSIGVIPTGTQCFITMRCSVRNVNVTFSADILQTPVYFKPLLYTCLQSDNVKTSQSSAPELHVMSLKIMLNIGAQFQYSDRLIENSNPQKITFSEVLHGALPVLSWQPISLFISGHISSYSAYKLINNCSFIWYTFCFRELNTF